jgi:hypothetical protein
MRTVAQRTLLIAVALPAAMVSLVRAIAKKGGASRRALTRVPRVALLVTVPFWLVVLLRGVLYPAFVADNLEQSWGGPTLAGAWVTHLVIGLGALGVASLAVALATGSRWWNVGEDSHP